MRSWCLDCKASQRSSARFCHICAVYAASEPRPRSTLFSRRTTALPGETSRRLPPMMMPAIHLRCLAAKARTVAVLSFGLTQLRSVKGEGHLHNSCIGLHLPLHKHSA